MLENQAKANNTTTSDKDTAIAFCADTNYFAYLSVAILSLADKGCCRSHPIFVVAEQFSDEEIQKFRSLSLAVGCRIGLLPLGLHAVKDLPSSGHMSRATYLRLLIPRIFRQFKKVLYLDSDLLVLSDLLDLLQIDISGYPVAAVRDFVGEKFCKIDFFKSGEKHYFNAGVLLINTLEWNKRRISERVLQIATDDSEREKISAFADQCLLNYVIRGEFFEIDKKYNWSTFEPHNCLPAILKLAPTPSHADLRKIKILHFTGKCKPWQEKSSLREIQSIYLQQLAKSPWRKQIDDKSIFQSKSAQTHRNANRTNSFDLPLIPSHQEKYASPGEVALIQLCRKFTMTPPVVVLNAIRATQYVVERHIDGDIVECGVWRGGISMAMAMRLQTLGQYRRLYLYDTFEGMSRPSEHDVAPSGQKAEHLLNQTQRDEKNHIWAYAPLEKVRLNFLSTGYPMEKVNFVKGKVEETIPETLPDKIALLRLDTDWYESTRHELIHLYPRLVSGGVLILDDYGFWAGARKAVDNFFENINPKPILKTVYDGIANSAHWAIKP